MNVSQVDFCGYTNNNSNTTDEHTFVFIWSLVPITSVTLGIHFFIKWINNMDYFPLKQRSPVLCIALMVSLLISINIYPALIISSYYQTDNTIQYQIYIALYYTTRSLSYLIYAIRSLRIVYAYRLQESMRQNKHLVFKFFKNQIFPILILIILFIIKFSIVYSYSSQNPQYLGVFSTFITKVPESLKNNLLTIDNLFFYRKLFEIFPWQIILAFCIWIQRKVNSQYSIVRELSWVLILSVVFSMAEIVSIAISKENSSGGVPICYDKISLQQISLMTHNIFLFGLSIIFPVLFHVRYYHTLLPIQQPYDLDNSLKNFLFEPRCFLVFYNFLKTLDEEDVGVPYTDYMISWTKIIKCKQQEEPNQKQIDDLIKKLEVTNLDSKAISTLNKSITIIREHPSDHDIEEAADSFNNAIEMLAEEIIQHLSIPYKTHFQKTKAYRKLKEIMDDNDRINTNMLMLNMILRQEQNVD